MHNQPTPDQMQQAADAMNKVMNPFIRLIHKATIEIAAPKMLNLGSEFDCAIRITPFKKCKIRKATVALYCVEKAIVRGTSDSTYYHNAFEDIRELEGAARLEIGRTYEYAEHFKIPVDAGPSFNARNHFIYWQIAVRLDVPWWPDTKEDHKINVQPVRLEA